LSYAQFPFVPFRLHDVTFPCKLYWICQRIGACMVDLAWRIFQSKRRLFDLQH